MDFPQPTMVKKRYSKYYAAVCKKRSNKKAKIHCAQNARAAKNGVSLGKKAVLIVSSLEHSYYFWFFLFGSPHDQIYAFNLSNTTF